VVEEIGAEPRRLAVDLQPGDVLVGWSRLSDGGPVTGCIASPFDVRAVGTEQIPRGDVFLEIERGEDRRTVTVPRAAWPFEVETRPLFSPLTLAAYEKGRARRGEKKIDEAIAAWREALSVRPDEPAAHAPLAACWLHARIAAALTAAARKDESQAAYREAWACLEGQDARTKTALLEDQLDRTLRQAWPDLAETALQAAEDIRDTGEAPLAALESIRLRGDLRYLQGRVDEAVDLYRQVLPGLESEVPASLPLARALNSLALALAVKGDFDEAERALIRSEAASAALASGGRVHRTALRFRGGLGLGRGDLVSAERFWRRDLELSGEAEGAALINLGLVALQRGDLDAAETWTRRALEMARQVDARPWAHLKVVAQLADITMARGDLAAAESLLREATTDREKAATDPFVEVDLLTQHGRLCRLRSESGRAKAFFERAVAVSEQGAGSRFALAPLLERAEMARIEQDWAAAASFYDRARRLAESIGDTGSALARALHGLGVLERRKGRLREASLLFQQAVAAIEGARASVGGTDEARSLYASRLFDIYHDHAALLVALGRPAEGYHVVEQSRARSLLAMIAERDLILEDEIPPALERRRRELDARYQRTQQDLMSVRPAADSARGRDLTRKLAELREEQARVADDVRQASPRLADLRYPEPLDAAAIMSALEPGTLLLAYSVGKDSTLLFALGAGGRGVARVQAVTIPLGEAALRREVDRYRDLLERTVPPPELPAAAEGLYDLLLRPVEARLDAARRVLVSPSGPLYALPMAAMRRHGRYLAETTPMVVVPSGTVWARWAQSRRESWPSSGLVAFADPRRPAGGRERLPETRHEAATLARLFPGGAIRVGGAATEANVRAVDRATRYVHFACHAVVNERLPLDSGLALQAEEGDDGLLQAWEIYERVRLDADLVTLSACRSASGATRAGEGLLGLTRAFQYAGARSVLAALWDVGDTSSGWFMDRFYARLRGGVSKDKALQLTQQAAIRDGQNPVRWAAYQIHGDWR
jgi:CHAT domain-containing protein/tetratricopeptide (TPR) repeat protein